VIQRAGAQLGYDRVEGVGRGRSHVAVVHLHARREVAVGETLGLSSVNSPSLDVAPTAHPSVSLACSSNSSPPASRQAMFVHTLTT